MNAHRVRLEPTALSVEPGKEASCTVRIANAGDVVDAFDVAVLGGPSAWTAVEPATVSLFPGTEGTARLTFRPPRSPDVTAGTTPFAVRVQSQDARLETSVVEEGRLDVGRFTELTADLRPRTSHGRLAGRHQVVLTNRGNAPTAVRLSGSDAEQALELVFAPATLAVPPGASAASGLRARCANVALTGTPRQWSFKVVGEADSTPPVEVQGTVEQRPVLGRWARRLLVVGAIALVAGAVLQYKGWDIRSVANRFVPVNGERAAQVSPGPEDQSGGSPSPSSSATPDGGVPSAGPGGAGGPGTTGAGAVAGGAAAAAAAMVPATACAGNAVSYSAPAGAAPIPGLSVTVNNGGVARQAFVSVSANLGVDTDAEVRVAYSVDGGPATENAFGPANLANHQQYYETRAVTAVIPLAAGSHTIAAYWRISGAAGRAAYMDRRCLTVKSVLSSPPASSLVVAAAACASGVITYSAPGGATPIPGLAVTVDNGSVARQALVNVSANLGVDANAEVRVAYSVDGGPAQENAYGPANLANYQQYYEGRDVRAVIPLAAGTHTVTAYWRISGAAGRAAHMDKRCLTVESAAAGAASATCPANAVSYGSAGAAAPIPGLSVAVDNGGGPRLALVEVTGNLGVDADAEVRLAYSVDGGPPAENAYGPANLANHQQYYEGRDATAVIPLGPGSHTITAYWRISGAAGKTAYMDKRCLTVEYVAA